MGFLTSSIVLAVTYLAIIATLAVVSALRAGGRREDAGDEQNTLAVSRFTIPVSIIVPITRNSASVTHAVATLLGLNYPEFEVIVVADDVPQAVFDELGRDWQLEAREFFYRKTIETSAVRRIYKSGRDPRLMIIDKAAGGQSDTLNCGVNVARYRYFTSVGPEVTFDRDALLRVMTAALRDPANVVGASNHIELGADAAGDAVADVPRESGPVARMIALFQRLASARSLMDSRLAWRYLGAGLGPTGAIVVWRRDAVIKLHGFSASAADPDIDLMFRLQTRSIEGGGRFDRGSDVFGRAGAQSPRGALRLAGRRQLAAIEILAACARGRGKGLSGKTLAYFVASELFTPLAQVWIVLATLFGASVGSFTWTLPILAIVLLSFGNAAVSAAALLLRGASAGAPEESELRRLLAAGPIEFVLYRPALAAARIAAAFSFVIPKTNN
jgi:hypothetical protein